MVEIFTGRMAFLFGALLQTPALVHLLNQLLLQAAVSRHVAPILLQYLVEHRLRDLHHPDCRVPNCSQSLMAYSQGQCTTLTCPNCLYAQPCIAFKPQCTPSVFTKDKFSGKPEQQCTDQG